MNQTMAETVVEDEDCLVNRGLPSVDRRSATVAGDWDRIIRRFRERTEERRIAEARAAASNLRLPVPCGCPEWTAQVAV